MSNVDCVCDFCNKNFVTLKRNIYLNIKRNQNTMFCNQDCFHKFKSTTIKLVCCNCNVEFNRVPDKRSKNYFCSSSCSATYNNVNKTSGIRRSKLEVWLEENLKLQFPDLTILFNDKATIQSELDILIPSINIAFEINGIFHYESIFGIDKLSKIQNNDIKKVENCLLENIDLHIIDTREMTIFSEKLAHKYLNKITHLVTNKLLTSKTDYVEVM